MATWEYERDYQNGAKVGESSHNASAQPTQLPSRRRQLGGMPLHPSRRPPPSHLGSMGSQSSFVPALSSPLRMNESNETPEPSVFLTPNSISRKRSHFSASSTVPSNSDTVYDLDSFQQSHNSYQKASSQMANSSMNAPESAESFTLSNDSPTNRYGSWSRKSNLSQANAFFEPQTSQPLRPPQGEFSFQAQAPSLYQANPVIRDFDSSTSQNTQSQGETSSMAFARLAQAQRQQQEARRLAASGANDTSSEDRSTNEHNDGPPVKKRRGVASTIVDGALNAALYTGAAALTAYSLWSSWGRKEENGEEASNAHDSIGASDSREKLPPGALEEPPPPYTLAGSSKGTSQSPMKNGRPVHVFVSSRRRRPVFATHRSSKSTPRRRMSALNDLSQQSPSAISNDTSHQQQGGEDQDEDDDEMFKRFQSKMSNLIEEGTRALNSEAELSAMDLEDDDDYSFQSTTLSPSKSDSRLAFNQKSFSSQLPRSQTTAFTFGTDALRRPQNTSSLFNSHSTAETATNSPRSPFLSLASRDPDSPYGRISRPGSASLSPTLQVRKRLH